MIITQPDNLLTDRYKMHGEGRRKIMINNQRMQSALHVGMVGVTPGRKTMRGKHTGK
jgi:hypothetical protein